MKPYFSTNMLIEMSVKEARLLRVAVANEEFKLKRRAQETGNKILEEEFQKYHQLHEDLTRIVEMLPF